MRLILEEQQKYLQSFISNATYHSMNPDTDVTYQTVNLFSSDSTYSVLTNVLSTSFLISILHSIKSSQHCLCNSSKGRCTRYMWSNDMFVLWNCISAIFYEDRKYCLHIFPWFLTSWTFRITSLLNLNEYQCYHHLDLLMIEGFHGFVMFSFSLSNAKETLQKMLARKCSYCGRIGNKC